ncbi:MAG: PKD domain-containing protein [Methanomassiliicoccales archaeon]|nr:MAG: PKD domain-containing protein [Methanomassiliicoccales archaeon]
MEGTGIKMPDDKQMKKGNKNKIMVMAVVAILIIAAIGAVVILNNNKKDIKLDVTSDATTITAGERIYFDASKTSGNPNKFNWRFGDGIEVNTTDGLISHVYQYPGKYLVVVKASNDGKSADNLKSPISITVNNPDPPSIPDDTTKPYVVVAVS